MARIIRLTEQDLTRIVRRVVSEQTDMKQEKFPTIKIANDVKYLLDKYKNDMDKFLSELQSDGDVDNRRFMSRIKNGTMELYREILKGLDNKNSPVINMLDKTFAHKQQELYGYFLDKLK